MPASGKSTLGKYLSHCLCWSLIDTDKSIEERVGVPLPQFIKEHGRVKFKEFEKEAIESIKCTHSIISTGGSVIYDEFIMRFLQSLGTIVYLHECVEVIEQRLAESNRVLMVKEGETLQDLYIQRTPLYKKYADVTIHVNAKSEKQIFEEIIGKINFVL